jgi:predicted ATPase with chaperone activity
MKQTKLSLVVMIASLLLLSGCGNRELKKDAARIGDVMCRNIDILNKMKAVSPIDSLTMKNLQAQSGQLQNEMTVLYKEFNQKYGEKIKDQEFTKEFNRELRKAMLNCPSLSKKDRELFEQDLKE